MSILLRHFFRGGCIPSQLAFCVGVLLFEFTPVQGNSTFPADFKVPEKAGRTIWVAIRTDGSNGSGSRDNPYDGSTAARMSAILHPYSTHLVPNITVCFAPGIYWNSGLTADWGPSTNWNIIGSGQDRTIIKVDPTSITYTGMDKRADTRTALFENGLGGVMVRNLTLDASASDFGSPLTAPFKMPMARDSRNGVSVGVVDSTPFLKAIGRWVHIEDAIPVDGKAVDYGLMQVISVPNKTHVQLMNSAILFDGTVTGTVTAGSPVVTGLSSVENLDEAQNVSSPGNIPKTRIKSVDSADQITLFANALVSGPVMLTYSQAFTVANHAVFSPLGNVPAGTIIPKTAYVLLEMACKGFVGGRPGDRIENVTVQNIQHPYYEGADGICFDSYGTTAGGGSIKNCTVRQVWGPHGWYISFTTPSGIEVSGNKVYGNGWGSGYSLGDASHMNFHDNLAANTGGGFFSDVGHSTYLKVCHNTFIARDPIQFSGGVLIDHSVFSQNKLTVTGENGVGIFFIGRIANSLIDNNSVFALPAVLHGAVGIQCRNAPLAGTMTGDTVEGSPVIRNIASVDRLYAYTAIHGPGIPPNARISDIDPPTPPTFITLNANATQTGSSVPMTYGPVIEGNTISNNHIQAGMLNFRSNSNFGVQLGNTIGTPDGGTTNLDLGLPNLVRSSGGE